MTVLDGFGIFFTPFRGLRFSIVVVYGVYRMSTMFQRSYQIMLK